MPPPSQQWPMGPAPMPGGRMPGTNGLGMNRLGMNGLGMNGLGMNMAGATASAYASANESVSVSQVGDQVILEMRSPDIGAGQLRMQGTRQQILDELKDSDLSRAAKQRVRAALR